MVKTDESPRLPRRILGRREQMMEFNEGERPAATVIRSSMPPVVRSSSSSKTTAFGPRNGGENHVSSLASTSPPKKRVSSDREMRIDSNLTPLNHRPVIISQNIRERPLTSNARKPPTPHTANESRFKKMNRLKNNGETKSRQKPPTAGGFPSLDLAPMGALTRRGLLKERDPGKRSSHNQIPPADTVIDQPRDAVDVGIGMSSDSILASMSLEDIRDGIDEVTSILSPELISFLRSRGQRKLLRGKNTKNASVVSSGQTLLHDSGARLLKDDDFKLGERNEWEEKVLIAQILSSVHTPEDMDRAYNEALKLGLANTLPSSTLSAQANENHNNIHVATSLLRSTAIRQRLLGAKSLCTIVRDDFNRVVEFRSVKSFSCSDDKLTLVRMAYPTLLPVALRCLIDDSIAISRTSVGKSLLALSLECVNFLMMLFVHPYHLVCLTQTSTGRNTDDPFVLFQTCFMSDISHFPAGSELYPPSSVEPIDDEHSTQGCYRSDSSAATAESDSKSFYDDPAWTLLSRMRMIPCIHEALVCISKDLLSGEATSEVSIRSICGILAMLSVRSPGAACAIAQHQGILPFISSICLSPLTSEENDSGANFSMFRTAQALPALKLLCLLAQQSRYIATLHPFEIVISDLQAILIIGTPNKEEMELQTWSLILFRILLTYGCATDCAQFLIHLFASSVVANNIRDKCAHYFMVFSRICDCASKARLEPDSSTENRLTTAEVWLSSSVKICLRALAERHSPIEHEQLLPILKQTAAGYDFITSYLSLFESTSRGSDTLPVEMNPIFEPTVQFDFSNEDQDSSALNLSLNVALHFAFSTDWSGGHFDISLEQEAAACRFVSSFMTFGCFRHDGICHNGIADKVLQFLRISFDRHQSTDKNGSLLHPARQSWFIESEFSILKFLCKTRPSMTDTSLVSAFAHSLLGRLTIGDEALARFIFQQDKLFQVSEAVLRDEIVDPSNVKFLQSYFLDELYSEERKAQFDHSFALHFSDSTVKSQSLDSLRSMSNFIHRGQKHHLLPLGGLWLWNVVSSTVISPPTQDQNILSEESHCLSKTCGVLCHAFGIILDHEGQGGSFFQSGINNGTKLYHTANVCLYPEAILRADYIHSSMTLLYEKFALSVNGMTLIDDFILACYHHSRVSRSNRASPHILPSEDSVAINQNENDCVSREKMIALEDFVGDMCDAYIEYGGQYAAFTTFMRLFLRHEFPPQILSLALSKLQPILNVLTLDEERDETFSSLILSVSGGLPSIDFSYRDPSSILDSFADILKNNESKILRSDYAYLLSVAVLSRNLSSSSQRCECGVQAMKQRLLGLKRSILYDIFKVCERFLHDGRGSRDSLITCVLDICLKNDEEGLMMQSNHVQMEWTIDVRNDEALWNKALASIRKIILPNDDQ